MSSQNMSNQSDAGNSPSKSDNKDNSDSNNSFTQSESIDSSQNSSNKNKNKLSLNKDRSQPNSSKKIVQPLNKNDSSKQSGNRVPSALGKKAQTQKMINFKSSNNLTSQQPFSPLGNQQKNDDFFDKPPTASFIDNNDDKKQLVKKQPKMSLKRQMTQRRMSNFSTVVAQVQNKPGRKSLIPTNIGDSSPFSPFGMNKMQQNSQSITPGLEALGKINNGGTGGGRNSLINIKDIANKSHGRQSMMITQNQGLNLPSVTPNTALGFKHKTLSGAIAEASEDEDSYSETDLKNETIMEFDNEEEDPFKHYENDALFNKVQEISDKITNPTHSEQELTEILTYLGTLPCMEGRFDHLNRSLKHKLIDTFEVRFVGKGEYLFKQGDKPDYAYVVLYGTVIYFKVVKNQYLLGQEPPSPQHDNKSTNALQSQQTKNMSAEQQKKYKEDQKEKELFENKKHKLVKDDLVIIEEEIKMPFEQGVGIMIGELAMLNPENTTRALSGMAKTDCIFLLLNPEAFDILVGEKEKKEKEALTDFIFSNVPKMEDLFQKKKFIKTIKIMFPTTKCIRGKEIIKEGDKCERLYIIKEGYCNMYKQVQIKDMLGMQKIKNEKIMTLEPGGIFGEEGLIFDSLNSYSVVANTPVVLLSISYSDLKREFKRLVPVLTQFYQDRNEFIQERYNNIKQARNFERKHFNSKIEKGSMNVFLQKDFKNQIDFADNKTKRKLQVFFLRKELQQLQDAKHRLNEELEREKQELTNFHHTSAHNNSTRFIPPLLETPQDQYVSKVLFPQRINKQQQQQSLLLNIDNSIVKQVKQTINFDLKQQQNTISPHSNNNMFNNARLVTTASTKTLLPIHNTSQLKSTVQPFSIMSPQQQHSQMQQFAQMKNQRAFSLSTIQQINIEKQNNNFLSPQNQAMNLIVDTDEDVGVKLLRTLDSQNQNFKQIQKFKQLSSRQIVKYNKAPMKGRTSSSLAQYGSQTQSSSNQAVSNSQIFNQNVNISLKGQTIRTDISQQHFFDKRMTHQQSQQQLKVLSQPV